MTRKLSIQLVICIIIAISMNIYPRACIMPGGSLQVGDNIADFSTAKIFSIKYGIPLYVRQFLHCDLFSFTFVEQLPHHLATRPRILVKTDADVIDNQDKDVLLQTDLRSRVNYVSPDEITELKKSLQLNKVPMIQSIPKEIITVGVHIRKGNGGGQFYDGEQSSPQFFDFDRSKIIYRTDFENFPFDWESYQRINGHFVKHHDFMRNSPIDVIWQTKFPPEQYYADQIIKVSNDLNNTPIFVCICTDDKNPPQLLERIKKAVKKPNIQYYMQPSENFSFHDRIWHDLFLLSNCDIFIRSQSYFARLAELIGNHKVVIYPLIVEWQTNKLIMKQIVIKGSIKSLLKKV